MQHLHTLRAEEIRRALNWLHLLRDHMTASLNQNGVVMAGSRNGKDAAAKLVKHIGTPEDPGYTLAFICWQSFKNILGAEEEEDLSQKGLFGLGEKMLPIIIQCLEEHLARLEKEAA